jgi:nucleoside-diphosphate-sugar epimerase
MRVFVTGATGFIGTPLVKELLDNGHEVLGMARTDGGAAKLTAAGAKVHRGDLADLDSLQEGAAQADGVIHLAYLHSMGHMSFGTRLGILLGGSPRGIVGRFAAAGAGADRKAMVPRLITAARKKNAAGYVGQGANRWPAAHKQDVARLFRLALEDGPAGSRYHAVAEEGVPMRSIAELISKRLNVPARSLTNEEAASHFGWLAPFVARDNHVSSELTRKGLGWTPVGPDLLTDLDRAGYFAAG